MWEKRKKENNISRAFIGARTITIGEGIKKTVHINMVGIQHLKYISQKNAP